MVKIEKIPSALAPEEINEALHIIRTRDQAQIERLLKKVEPLINARAVYKMSYVGERLTDTVFIEGIPFKSSVLRKNLDGVGRVFPYVVTIGKGLEDMVRDCDDLLEQYYLEIIGNMILIRAHKYLECRLNARFGIHRISCMSPGSLEDWPIEQQKSLFSLLGDVKSAIGVKLNASFLMIPRKSLSGVFFPSEVTFYSCQLCPRKHCEDRRAPYTETLAREFGILE